MAEYLLESGKGGAVAVVAYNPCGVNSTSQVLFKEVLNRVFRDGETCLGRAVFAARCSVIARYPTNDNLYGPAVLWTILGDPALRLKYRVLSGTQEPVRDPSPGLMLAAWPSVGQGAPAVCLRVPAGGPVRLQLYDAAGLLVQTLVAGRREPGRYRARPTGGLGPGIYLLRLDAGRVTATAKFVVTD